MPLPGIKRRRSGSDEEPGELVDDDSSSASDSEPPRSEDRERSQSKRSSRASSSGYYRDKERDRSRERSWDYYDRSSESHWSWHQSGDRSRHWSDRNNHRYIHRRGSSPPPYRQQFAGGRLSERHLHSYHSESKRRRYSSEDHDQRLLSSFSGEHEKFEVDYSEDSLPYKSILTSNVPMDVETPEETVQPHSPLEPPPDFHESEISCSPPVVEPSFVSEMPDSSAVVKVGDSPSRMTKEELLHSMDLADREITEVEQQIGKLKRRLAQEETELQNELAALEEKAKEEVKQEDKSPSVVEPQQANEPEATTEKNEELNIPYNESTRQLILKIYGENRRKAAASRALLAGKGYPMANSRVPLYNQPSDLPFYNENQERAKAFYPVLVNHLRMKHKKRIAFENWRIAKYQQLQVQWEKTLEAWENNPTRKLRETKIREFYERMFPEIRKQREREERIQRAKKSWSFARSEAELNEIADILHEQELVQCQIVDLSVMPPPLLCDDERKVEFINRNGLIEDPMADHRNRRMSSVWSDAEKKIFREEFVRHPKDFDNIAKALPNKKYTDCVQYYYLSKKKEGYKQLVRKHTLAKRKSKVLQQRPQLALGLEEQGRDLRESILSMETEDDSKKSSTPGPSLQRWSEEEIQAMKEGLREYGKDWLTISIKVGTKTEHQCRSFFRHYRRKVHLVGFLNEFKAREKAGVETLKQSGGIPRIDEDDDEDEDLQKAARVYSTVQQPHSIASGVLAKDVHHQVGPAVTDIASRFALVPTPEHDQFISIAASMVDDYGKSHMPDGSLEQPVSAFPVVSSRMQTSDTTQFSGALLPSELPTLSVPALSTSSVAADSGPLSTGTASQSGLDLIAAAAEAVAAQMAQTLPTAVSQPIVHTTIASQKQGQVRLEDLPRCLSDPRLENVSQASRQSVAPLHAVTVRTSTAVTKPLTLHFTPSQGVTSQTKPSVSPSNVLTLLIPLQTVPQAQASTQARPVQLSTSQSPGTTVAALVDATALASPIQMPSPGSLSSSTAAVNRPRLTLRGNPQTVVRLAVRHVAPYSQSIATQLLLSQANRLTTVSSLPTTSTLTVLAAPPPLVSSSASSAIVTPTRSIPTLCGAGPIVVGASGIPLDHSDLVKTQLETPGPVVTAPTVLEKPDVVKLSTSDTSQPSVDMMATSTDDVSREALEPIDAHIQSSVSQVSRVTLCLPREPLLQSVEKAEIVETMDTSDSMEKMDSNNFPDLPSSPKENLIEVSIQQSSLQSHVQEIADRRGSCKVLADDSNGKTVVVEMETDKNIDESNADDSDHDHSINDDMNVEEIIADKEDTNDDMTGKVIDSNDGNEKDPDSVITENVVDVEDGHKRDADSEITEIADNDRDDDTDNQVTEHAVDKDGDRKDSDGSDLTEEVVGDKDSHKDATCEITKEVVGDLDGHKKYDDSDITVIACDDKDEYVSEDIVDDKDEGADREISENAESNVEGVDDEDVYKKNANIDITEEVVDNKDDYDKDVDSGEITEVVDLCGHEKDTDSEVTEKVVDDKDSHEDTHNEIAEKIDDLDGHKGDADSDITEEPGDKVDDDNNFDTRSVESGEIIESDDDEHISDMQSTGIEPNQQPQREYVKYGKETTERIDREVNLDEEDCRIEKESSSSPPQQGINEEVGGNKLRLSDESNTLETRVNISNEVQTAKLTDEELELSYDTVTSPDQNVMLPELCSIGDPLVGVNEDEQREEEREESETDTVRCTKHLEDVDELDELELGTAIVQDDKNGTVQMPSRDDNEGLSSSGLQHIEDIDDCDGLVTLQSHEAISPISDRDNENQSSDEMTVGVIDEFSRGCKPGNPEVDFSMEYESISPPLPPQSTTTVSQESIPACVTQFQESPCDAPELPATISPKIGSSCSSIVLPMGRTSPHSSPLVKSPSTCGLHEGRSGAFLPASLPAIPSFGGPTGFSPRHSPPRSIEHVTSQAFEVRTTYGQVIEDISSDDEY